MQTDIVDGFLLDRGFQIFLTSYKEAQAMLDYQSLDLKPFYAGKPALPQSVEGNKIACKSLHQVPDCSCGPPGETATHAGALVRWNGAFHRVADPLRHFGDGLGSLPNPVGSPIDKALVGLFRLKSLLKSEDAIFQSPETTTYSRLKVCHSCLLFLLSM